MEKQIIRKKIIIERRVTSVPERVKSGRENKLGRSLAKLSKFKFHLAQKVLK